MVVRFSQICFYPCVCGMERRCRGLNVSPRSEVSLIEFQKCISPMRQWEGVKVLSQIWKFSRFMILSSRSGIQRCARRTDGHGFEPRPKPPPMLVDMSASTWIKKDSAMLTSIQSAGVTPEVNLRITKVRKHTKRDPPWLWNPVQTSPEVQNRGISGPHKKELCPPKILIKKVFMIQTHHTLKIEKKIRFGSVFVNLPETWLIHSCKSNTANPMK